MEVATPCTDAHLKRVVDSAKERAVSVGKPDLARAVEEMYQRSFQDAHLMTALQAILTQTATPLETFRFQMHAVSVKQDIVAEKSTADDKSALLQLPPELRNRIYRHVLCAGEPLCITKPVIAEMTALLRTCKTTRSEGSSIFFAENSFLIRLNVDNLALIWDYFSTIGKERCKRVEKVSLEYQLSLTENRQLEKAQGHSSCAGRALVPIFRSQRALVRKFVPSLLVLGVSILEPAQVVLDEQDQSFSLTCLRAIVAHDWQREIISITSTAGF